MKNPHFGLVVRAALDFVGTRGSELAICGGPVSCAVELGLDAEPFAFLQANQRFGLLGDALGDLHQRHLLRLAGLLDGFRDVARHPVLRLLLPLTGAVSLFGWPLLSLLPALSKNRLGSGERGYSANQVAAVMEVESAESKPDRLDLLPKKLDAVRQFGDLPESASLAAANKRIANIIRQAHDKGEKFGIVDHDNFPEQAERDLYHALRQASAKAAPQFEKVLREPAD